MIPLDEIRRARERIGDSVQASPLVLFDERVWLKLENLHPIGCFKLRGALNKVRSEPEVRDLVTASAGNMAQGVAWAACEVGVSATIVAMRSGLLCVFTVYRSGLSVSFPSASTERSRRWSWPNA